jgi:Cu2+-exporting ATPase
MIASLSSLKKKSLAALQEVQQETIQPLLAEVTTLYQEGREETAHLFDYIGGYVQEMQQEMIQPLMTELTPLYQEVREEAAPFLNKIGGYLRKLDEQWQTFVHTRIDPLLGGARGQQLTDLGIQMSAAEKDINRRLILAAGNIGVALLAAQVFLPLAALYIGLIAWLGMPMFQRSYLALVQERRLTYPIVLLGAELAIILGGHFVAGSVAMFIIVSSNKLINRTEDHFRRNITDALGQQPRTVWRLVNGAEVDTPLEDIRQTDVLLIGAGEMIAVDGVIIDGAAMIDQHRLTGEAQPAEKTVGDEVLASTVVLSGKIRVQVQKTGKETSAAQIAVILQRVARTRLAFSSRVENFVDGMTLPMLGLGGIAWLTLGTEAAAAIMSVAAGSVARFGGPLSMLSYLNIAARHGLLIKDARSFEILKKVDMIIFDKTGTLTLEQPQVSRIHLCQKRSRRKRKPPVSEELLLRYAAAAESKQSHPIAKAIMTAVQARGLTVPAISDAHLEIGYGIKVRVAHDDSARLFRRRHWVRVGSRRFMEMEGIAVPTELESVQEACHAQGHSLVLVALNKQVAGAIELQPTIRPEAQQAIAALRRREFGLYIISGDHAAPTRQLAQQLGIEHYFAGVLPQDKADRVEQLKAEGRTVCFVGDGINDGLALGKADVSVSLRGASTLATDTAQVVLMSQDLRQLEFLLHLAREFDKSLGWLFRLTLVPVGIVVISTFAFHTGIYVALLIWQLGVMSGIGLGLLPLLKYPAKPDMADKKK